MKQNFLLKTFMVCALVAPVMVSCSDDEATPTYKVEVTDILPNGYVLQSINATFTEINTGVVTTSTNLSDLHLAAGTYNIEATATVIETGSKAAAGEKTMRAVAQNVVITENTKSINLDWFFYNPSNSLVLSEIFVAGSLNATGSSTLSDAFFCVYNNTDEIIYADGLALCESYYNNHSSYKDATITMDNNSNSYTPETALVTGAVYVIPGNGTDVPILPGKSIKIVDQAINWAEDVPHAQNHTNADFEWYDEVTTGSTRDTDNPDVPNLNKWFCYSNTVWPAAKQCNRSYAIVRFPAGMTSDTFNSEYACTFTYTGSTGKPMTQKDRRAIPNEWILDGVNLASKNKMQSLQLGSAVDMSYYNVVDNYNSLPDVAYHNFVRRQAGISPAGNIILQDTDDSANDFETKLTYEPEE